MSSYDHYKETLGIFVIFLPVALGIFTLGIFVIFLPVALGIFTLGIFVIFVILGIFVIFLPFLRALEIWVNSTLQNFLVSK